jgi:ribosomal subunit interface protein
VETGDALRAHVEERLDAIADKYFSRAISAQVTFGTGPHDNGFSCAIIAHVMQGLILKADHHAMDAHLAFDGAADRIEKQLRRYMRRLKDHHATPTTPDEAGFDGTLSDAAYTVFDTGNEDEEAPDNPLIVAETRVEIPNATVSHAVMMMDLRHTGALMFRNSGTGDFNMVYRRDDGTIGWVEPARAAG